MSEMQRQSIYRIIDNLSDTASWSELAKELNRCVAKSTAAAPDNDPTIEMEDLIKSLGSEDSRIK